MRGRSLNPSRRETPSARLNIFDQTFLTFVAPLPARIRSRNSRNQQSNPRIKRDESHNILQRRQRQRSFGGGGVLFGSRPLSQPTRGISTPQELHNPRTPITARLTLNSQGTARSQESFGLDLENDFLGPNAAAQNPTINPQTPAAPTHIQGMPSSDMPSNIFHLTSPSPSSFDESLSFVDPIPPNQLQYLTPGFGSPSVVPSNASRSSDVWMTAPNGLPQQWDLTLHSQLEVSFMSFRAATSLGCIPEVGLPTWSSWFIQTPGGIVQPQFWVSDVTIESRSDWLLIPTMTTNFIVLDRLWTETEIVLGRPILERMLRRQ
ncbi:hypothetical protein BKA56DRAFT_366496 [Ilyonectria sp. MPI-CAGE-AT-0026]|nr:hypothetical protein BKA56DRAFT_366496 [Ilyonectria sp. MPI-CAGE-AT-0026]